MIGLIISGWHFASVILVLCARICIFRKEDGRRLHLNNFLEWIKETPGLT